MRRLSCCFVAGRWNVRLVPLMPMRSTVPYSFLFNGLRAWYTANLMLEDPPLIVRMHGSAGFMLGSFVRQSERSEFRAGGPVIRVKDASDPQTFRDLDEHRGVFDIDYLPGWRLGDVQRKPKDVRVGLADVDEAGGNKGIYKPVQVELSNPVRIQFASFVADHDDFESVVCLE